MDSERLSGAIVALAELVARLRGPGGCPWDAKQTDSSIKIYLLEEAYEVLEAIEKSSAEDVCEELGDLLFQILFLAQLGAEQKQFDFVEVVERITDKMIKRHPHVFGDTKVDSAKDVAFNWANIKKKEKGCPNDASSALKSVPVSLPALLRAHRLSERASKVAFDWASKDEIWDKVQKEFEELGSAILKGDKEDVAEEVGNLLFSLVTLARHWGLNAEHLLRVTNKKFLERFEEMERQLKLSGLRLEEATPEQMNKAWKKTKN
jgi:MazG family protein